MRRDKSVESFTNPAETHITGLGHSYPTHPFYTHHSKPPYQEQMTFFVHLPSVFFVTHILNLHYQKDNYLKLYLAFCSITHNIIVLSFNNRIYLYLSILNQVIISFTRSRDRITSTSSHRLSQTNSHMVAKLQL